MLAAPQGSLRQTLLRPAASSSRKRHAVSFPRLLQTQTGQKHTPAVVVGMEAAAKRPPLAAVSGTDAPKPSFLSHPNPFLK